ncbi:MAG: tripartite tricarboxylate transporter permease [Bacillota bacterium]
MQPNTINILLILSISFIIVTYCYLTSYKCFFATLVTVPRYFLLPTIILLSVVGTYALQNSIFDVWIMIFFGVVGYILCKFEMPFGPLILGLILGPIAESNFRRSLIISDGSMTVFLTRPISLILIIAVVFILVLPTLKKYYNKRKSRASAIK